MAYYAHATPQRIARWLYCALALLRVIGHSQAGHSVVDDGANRFTLYRQCRRRVHHRSPQSAQISASPESVHVELHYRFRDYGKL